MAELAISPNDYTAKQNTLKPAKKRAPQWKVKAVREREKQQQSLALVERNLNKIFKQCEKWLQAFESGDKKQMNRQYNRITKSLGLLEQVEVNSHKLTEIIDSMTNAINDKSKKAQLLPNPCCNKK